MHTHIWLKMSDKVKTLVSFRVAKQTRQVAFTATPNQQNRGGKNSTRTAGPSHLRTRVTMYSSMLQQSNHVKMLYTRIQARARYNWRHQLLWCTRCASSPKRQPLQDILLQSNTATNIIPCIVSAFSGGDGTTFNSQQSTWEQECWCYPVKVPCPNKMLPTNIIRLFLAIA